MKNGVVLIFLVFEFFSCNVRHQKVDRITEDGAEVVLNHLEPYHIEGEPTSLHFEEECTIDTEKDTMAEAGLSDINSFDVDSEGNIYFFEERESAKYLVHKFDNKGRFTKSFIKRGQGPGEIQIPIFQPILAKNEIRIQDYGRRILFVFDGDGALIREIRLPASGAGMSVLTPLENGNYVEFKDYVDPSSKHRCDVMSLRDSSFEEIKELDRNDYGPPFMAMITKKKGSPRVFIGEISSGKIYLGNESRGYEILIYNLDGRLLEKIRKEYRPADVPDAFRENLRLNFELLVLNNKLIIPDKMPPFHYFFLDDEGRLYVKTYEKGSAEHESIHDIFNSAGCFIKRASLPGYGNWIGPGRELNRPKFKNHRFYCIREKENGFKELVVARTIWS
jgi:hypothetical protein